MDQQVWNPLFSPNGTTPGKSPSYYNELDQQQQLSGSQQQLSQLSPNDNQHHQQQLHLLQQQHLQHQQQQQLHGHSDQSTPAGNAIQLNISSSQQPTPTQLSGNTPGAFSESDHMFLQQMDYYEQQHQHQHQQQQQQQLSLHASVGNTPGSNTGSMAFNQHQPQQHLPSHGHASTNHHNHSQDISQQIHLDSNGASNQNTPSSNSGGAPLPPQTYDLGLENMNFIIPEVLNFDTDPDHVSSAFPPELPSNQTPSLLAVNKLKQGEQPPENSVSPILRGQNDKSYNPHHYYHRQSSSGKIFTNSSQNTNSNTTSTVRPGAVFTPLVSPVVTPLERGNSGNAFSPQAPLQISFEPLTSPVLKSEPLTVVSSNASTSGHTSTNDDRRRSSSSVYGPGKDENKQYKRRTPHGTPILQGSKSSYVSPSLKSKSGSGNSSGNNSQHQFTFEKLPESKIKSETSSLLSSSNKEQDMLPPKSGKPVEINGTPLMGFTMGKLAEGNEQQQQQKLRQTSPTMSSSKKSSTRSSRKSSISKHQNSVQKSSSSSSEEEDSSSPKLNSSTSSTTTSGGGKKSGEKPATKKASHKLAEQGRRNRMNMAVQELGKLIPQSYHDEVSIPSKATTVELASKYINSLLQEIDELKNSNTSSEKNNGK